MFCNKSKQTGWIHYNPHSTDGRHDTIPVIENACHILELLQTKASEHLYEAKFLLERLLAFQTPSGNFPHYLHEYPHAYSSLTAFELLTPLHLMQRDFGNILPDLAPTLQRLHAFCASVLDRKFVTPAHKTLLNAATDGPCIWEAETSRAWSLLLQAYRLKPDPLCLQNLSRYWHPTLSQFIGLREHQEGYKPAPSLIDLFMQSDVGGHPIALRRSLVVPIELQGSAPDRIALSSYMPREEDKMFHLMRWVHPEADLVCQAKHFALNDNTYTFPEERHDLEFYVSHTCPISVDGMGASAFALGQKVAVGPFELTFKSASDAVFMGHISRGNRPSQIAARGDRRFETYDWRIALRCVSRTGEAKARVICKVQPS